MKKLLLAAVFCSGFCLPNVFGAVGEERLP